MALNKYYFNSKGKRTTKEKLSKELSRIGLTIADYENVRKFDNRNSSKSRGKTKRIWSILNELEQERDFPEEHDKVIDFLRSTSSNVSKAFLNGSRISKNDLADFIQNYIIEFTKEFYFFYINITLSTKDYKVYLDEELLQLIQNAEQGEVLEDRHGNVVHLSSKNKIKKN